MAVASFINLTRPREHNSTHDAWRTVGSRLEVVRKQKNASEVIFRAHYPCSLYKSIGHTQPITVEIALFASQCAVPFRSVPCKILSVPTRKIAGRLLGTRSFHSICACLTHATTRCVYLLIYSDASARRRGAAGSANGSRVP